MRLEPFEADPLSPLFRLLPLRLCSTSSPTKSSPEFFTISTNPSTSTTSPSLSSELQTLRPHRDPGIPSASNSSRVNGRISLDRSSTSWSRSTHRTRSPSTFFEPASSPLEPSVLRSGRSSSSDQPRKGNAPGSIPGSRNPSKTLDRHSAGSSRTGIFTTSPRRQSFFLSSKSSIPETTTAGPLSISRLPP